MKKPIPTAFLHILHQELDQKQKRLSLTDDPYFGQRGYDYDPTYSVTCDPLFTSAELLAPYEHDGELHKAVFMALESYGGADTFRDGVLALVQQSKERGAELAELKTDAARYRFLRDGTRSNLEYWDNEPAVCTDEDAVFWAELDQVVDVAMAEMLQRSAAEKTEDAP